MSVKGAWADSWGSASLDRRLNEGAVLKPYRDT